MLNNVTERMWYKVQSLVSITSFMVTTKITHENEQIENDQRSKLWPYTFRVLLSIWEYKGTKNAIKPWISPFNRLRINLLCVKI